MTVLTSYPEQGVVMAQWPSLTPAEATTSSGNPVQPAQLARWGCKSVQISGAFDGATVTIEGSNDGQLWFPLTDSAAHPTDDENDILSFTSDGLRDILQNTRAIRPSVTLATGGSSSLDVSVTIIGS